MEGVSGDAPGLFNTPSSRRPQRRTHCTLTSAWRVYSAVVSLPPMSSLSYRDTNTNDNTTVTQGVMGRWWLSDEQEQVQPH